MFKTVTIAVALSAACMLSCNNVKQDTPQAAVATFIKMYEREKFDRVADLVEPTFTNSGLRMVYCMDVYFRPDPYERYSCMCSGRGAAAVKNAKPYAQSQEHIGLRRMGLSTKTCEIQAAHPVEGERELDDLIGFHSARFCDEASEKDHLAQVTFKCEGHDAMTLVLREREGKWRVLMLSDKAAASLAVVNITGDAAENAKSQKDVLNKDMK